MVPDSDLNGFHPVSPRDPVDAPDLHAVDALLTAAGERWQRIHMSPEHVQQHLDALVQREHAGVPAQQHDTELSRAPKPILQGERLTMKPSWRTTSIGIALTLCLIAASVGVFVIFSHQQRSASVAGKPTASPTPRGPLTMPPALIDLAMVSDHEGWALQNLADITTTPTTSPAGKQLWHFTDGAWAKVALPGLTTPYTGNLAMASAADGWLLTHISTQDTTQSVIYHYDGSVWKQIVLPHLLGSGTPELDSLQVAANGDAWLTGNYLDLTGKTALQSARAPLSALSCLPNCGHALVLHWEQGQWTEIPVPANVTIVVDGGTLGWFPGTESDQMTLYHYQGGAWTKLRLGVAASPNWVAMATPTDGWIGALEPKNPGSNDGENNWVMYHFDGKTVQRIAAVVFQHCFDPDIPMSSAISPDEIWVPLLSDQDCRAGQQLWHLHGNTATTVAPPSPYVALGVTPQNDASGNAWLLAAQQRGVAVGAAPYNDQREAILRWNGTAWVLYAQTQG